MSYRPARSSALLVPLLLLTALATTAPIGQSAPTLPDRLSDTAYWQLIEQFSEPGGTFHSENYISNENAYQHVIPDLVARARPGGLYLGVGPEQNFTYIAAIRPRMVFITDIRRGNMLEHLLYKALMELSPDRAAFLSRLFSRARPANLNRASTVQQLFDAFSHATPSEALFNQHVAAVLGRLTKTHAFPLTAEDRRAIEFIYRTAFFTDGPDLMYRRTDFVNAGRRPTYAELMTAHDGQGRQRSYLADEASFAFLKDLQSRNLLVPIVGDFSGPKALRAVAKYARTHDATVSAFYLSNVETYLNPRSKWDAFCASVAAMPLDASSTFIRSLSRSGGFVSFLGSMQDETRACAGR